MTNNENDTPVTDGTPPEAETAEAPAAAQPQDDAAKLADQLAAVQQDLLYARAETQNVRRRAEKEVADAHAYAATKFARDILSVADNLGRALAAIGEEQREDERFKPFVAGLAATERELMGVFERHGVTRIAAIGRSEEHTSAPTSLMRITYA